MYTAAGTQCGGTRNTIACGQRVTSPEEEVAREEHESLCQFVALKKKQSQSSRERTPWLADEPTGQVRSENGKGSRNFWNETIWHHRARRKMKQEFVTQTDKGKTSQATQVLFFL